MSAYIYTWKKGMFQVRVTMMQQTSRSRTSNRLRISGLSNWALVALTAVSRIPVRLCWYKVVAGRASSGLVVVKQTVMAYYQDIPQQQFSGNCSTQWNTFLTDFQKLSYYSFSFKHEENQWAKSFKLSIHGQLYSWISARGVTLMLL